MLVEPVYPDVELVVLPLGVYNYGQIVIENNIHYIIIIYIFIYLHINYVVLIFQNTHIHRCTSSLIGWNKKWWKHHKKEIVIIIGN